MPLPSYASQMAAYHAAFAPELRTLIESLPVPDSSKVLDVACGDGTYSRWLALRFGPRGSIHAIDISPTYLKEASKSTDHGPSPDRILYTAADLNHLPFPPASFDLAWCAQSLFSLPDPTESLRAIASTVRPGGLVAVLETDTLHQVLLPWPIELELAVRSAELAHFASRSDHPRKYYIGRRLRQVFESAGLSDVERQSWTIDRQAPLDEPTHAFLASYLSDLLDSTRPRLSPPVSEQARDLLDPASPRSLLARPDLAFTLLEHLVWGRVPAS